MRLQVIGTGSSGNAYMLWDGSSGILLDAGLPLKKIMAAIGHQSKAIRACLVTHEHGDHASAVRDLDAVGIRCYGTPGTAALVPGLRSDGLSGGMVRVFGDIATMAFPTNHDAADPCGYLITNLRTGEKMLYATDTYYLTHRYPGIHYWLIECNYCEERLTDDMHPALLRRIRESHMSLEALEEVFRANDLSECRKVILCHLSRERADPDQMIRRIRSIVRRSIEVARAGVTYELSADPF